MSDFVSVVFCRNCKSRYVEITDWTEDKKTIFYCRSCNSYEVVEKFTLGRCRVANSELQNARDTRAIPKKPER
ncbi:MAG: hypothetical protein SVR08_16460 [Spirochaetota bacterium]|nr:hypothetical protein [Spirochaetota bacterium]